MSSSAEDPTIYPVYRCVCYCLSAKPDPDRLRQLLEEMRAAIPGIIELHFGANLPSIGDGSAAAAAGEEAYLLCSRHYNGGHLKAFLVHPAQLALTNYLRSLSLRSATAFHFLDLISNL